MRRLLELIRIIVIFAVVLSALGCFLTNIYLGMGIDTEKFGFIGFTPIFILFFVLYRNKLQFSGWYEGEGKEKLLRKVTQIFILSTITLLFYHQF